MKNKAKELFHGEQRYNCAQAVLAAFQDRYEVSQERIDEFKAFGGGRAVDGLCGALYAGLTLSPDEQTKLAMKEAFERLAGSHKCREIRKNGKLPCPECVALAAEMLDLADKMCINVSRD